MITVGSLVNVRTQYFIVTKDRGHAVDIVRVARTDFPEEGIGVSFNHIRKSDVELSIKPKFYKGERL